MPENRAPKGGEMYRAGLPSLGARLLAVAGFVRPAAIVADIGCDHGKLAVWLAKAGRAQRVIATDLNPLPLARASALVAQTGCGGRVECRLGDGLDPIRPGEVGDVILAGLSGETMADILAAAPWLQSGDMRLVLAPVTHGAELRGWLWQNGFEIVSETAVQEAGRVYAVLCADYTGAAKQPTPLALELGKLAGRQDDATIQYIETRLQDLRNRLAAPLEPDARKALEALIQEIQACLS